LRAFLVVGRALKRQQFAHRFEFISRRRGSFYRCAEPKL
jgi:hypothetical protein